MTRLRVAIGLLLLVLVGGTLFATLGRGSDTGGGASLGKGYRSSLGWSIRYPRAMHVEHSAAISRNGHLAVDETTFASFHPKPGVQHRISPQSESIGEIAAQTRSGIFPANGIALRVESAENPFPVHRVPVGATHLPLRLSEFHKAQSGLHGGTGPQFLWHSLLARGQTHITHTIQVWIGPRASARQLALLDRMIASISVRRVVPGQS